MLTIGSQASMTPGQYPFSCKILDLPLASPINIQAPTLELSLGNL